MTAAALLDTSYLITLFNRERPHHATAVQYYRHMLQSGVDMHFSSVVAAEYGIKQDIANLPLDNFLMLSFNVAHGQTAARLWNALGSRDTSVPRTVARDDVKLIAQAHHEGIALILTEDQSSLVRDCTRLRDSGHVQLRAITLAEGFDAEAFNADGQRGLVFPGAAQPD